jgi:hypothetical protein
MSGMVTRDIRAFVSRDWRLARRAKDEYWRDRIVRLGAGEAWRIADDLRRQARLLDPAWPDAADRRRDLLAHVKLGRRLRRAGSARVR